MLPRGGGRWFVRAETGRPAGLAAVRAAVREELGGEGTSDAASEVACLEAVAYLGDACLIRTGRRSCWDEALAEEFLAAFERKSRDADTARRLARAARRLLRDEFEYTLWRM